MVSSILTGRTNLNLWITGSTVSHWPRFAMGKKAGPRGRSIAVVRGCYPNAPTSQSVTGCFCHSATTIPLWYAECCRPSRGREAARPLARHTSQARRSWKVLFCTAWELAETAWLRGTQVQAPTPSSQASKATRPEFRVDASQHPVTSRKLVSTTCSAT